MPNADAAPVYSEVIALLRKAVVLCDDNEIARSATPHVDLALNLLIAEYQSLRVPAAARD